MNPQKPFLRSLQEDYDWQTLTDNYNERKIVELVERLSNNATERSYTLAVISNSDDGRVINEAFMGKLAKYYVEQQIEEVLMGHDLRKDYIHLLDGIDKASETDFLYECIGHLQNALRKQEKRRDKNNGMFHVENINNYGYISDLLNQHNKEQKK